MNYIEYGDLAMLVAEYKKNRSRRNATAIGRWYELYGKNKWKGGYYDCGNLGNLFPIYKEDVQQERLYVIGYEFR